MLRSLGAMSASDRFSIAGTFGIETAGNGDELAVILDYSGDLRPLQALGVKVRTQLGSIITANIPFDAVDRIADLPGLKYVQPAMRFYPMLDMSVPNTRANLVRSGVAPEWTGYTGKGVIIGSIDTGIDANHQDFKDPAGMSRVLYVWDQSTGTGGSNHPAGYSYGTEWTKAQVDAGQYTLHDGGHGTGVMGIAAGDGSATGNGWPAYRYVGMAPEADIMAVKSTLYDDAIIDGMNYIKNKASALGKPCVINLSIGSQMGAHDGTSAIERAIDQISGQGVVVCTASGNSGTSDTTHYIHAQWSTPSHNSQVTAGLNVTATRANPFYMDLWYRGDDSIDITLTSPNGYRITKATGSTTGGYFSTPDGGIWIDNAPGGANPYNNDRECMVFVQNALAGAWTLTAKGQTINSGGTCNAYIESFQNVYWSSYGTNLGSVTIPGTSSSVITVGGYYTKTQWNNVDGTPRSGGGSTGAFFNTSGEGPTRDGRQKPDMCVPSIAIATALSATTTTDPAYLVEDGVHRIQSGTSFAVPHMSGGAALLLQRDPTATATEIKSYLMSTARADSFTGAVPNTRWGVGKLDVQAAMSLTPMYTDILTARIQADGTPVKLPSQVVTAGLNQFSDRFYIESADRTAGIQVRTGTGTGIQAAEGAKVAVNGTVGLADGERAVLDPTVTPAGPGTVPGPLSMVNRSVGGGLLGDHVPGVSYGIGLNNVGLLVKVWGKVTYVGSDHFYINDGTGLTYTAGRVGLKIFCGSLAKPILNHSVVVTGISTLDWDGSTARPVVRARKQSDLKYY